MTEKIAREGGSVERIAGRAVAAALETIEAALPDLRDRQAAARMVASELRSGALIVQRKERRECE